MLKKDIFVLKPLITMLCKGEQNEAIDILATNVIENRMEELKSKFLNNSVFKDPNFIKNLEQKLIKLEDSTLIQKIIVEDVRKVTENTNNFKRIALQEIAKCEIQIKDRPLKADLLEVTNMFNAFTSLDKYDEICHTLNRVATSEQYDLLKSSINGDLKAIQASIEPLITKSSVKSQLDS